MKDPWVIVGFTAGLIGLDYFVPASDLIGRILGHLLIIAGAFYLARAVWRYHSQTIIPDLVDLTHRLGRQPEYIGPYNGTAYLATALFFVAIGYGIHTAMLLGLIH